MQHLHGASSRSRLPVPALCFLVLWSVTAVPVTKKAHGSTAACRHGWPWGAVGGWMQPEAIQRDTCVFLGGHGTAPFWGKEPSALGCRNSRFSGARWPPGSSWRCRGGVPCGLAPPRLCTQQRRRERFGGPPPSPGQHRTCPTSTAPDLCFHRDPWPHPDEQRVIVTVRAITFPSNYTSFCAGEERARQAGDTQLSLLHKFKTNKKKGFSELEKNAQQHRK